MLPFLQEWREYLYPKLIAFVRPAIAYCQERRLSAGRLNFQDLLMETAKLLRSHREVRTYFAQKYQRILVDEFQDTDPVQAELIFLLTGASESILEDLDWRQLKPRPGSLFLVGDPKQSIYRFRRADISIYNEVKARIRECGAVLKLTSNFRSVPSIGSISTVGLQINFLLSKRNTKRRSRRWKRTGISRPKQQGMVYTCRTIPRLLEAKLRLPSKMPSVLRVIFHGLVPTATCK